MLAVVGLLGVSVVLVCAARRSSSHAGTQASAPRAAFRGWLAKCGTLAVQHAGCMEGGRCSLPLSEALEAAAAAAAESAAAAEVDDDELPASRHMQRRIRQLSCGCISADHCAIKPDASDVSLVQANCTARLPHQRHGCHRKITISTPAARARNERLMYTRVAKSSSGGYREQHGK
jgi:hypothetical protein